MTRPHGHDGGEVSWLETFGLIPLGERLHEMVMVFRGDPHVPPSRFGPSSLRILRPWIAWPTWLGRIRADRRVPIYNFFNRTPTPVEQGWSVRVTQVRDFRGGRRTYDSHNGTDFVVPVGTRVTAPAPGRVLLISNDFNRGGLKIFVDHGQGLVTSANHLARALTRVGADVARGEVIALSGASGVENLLCFPWVAPHVHFNVWLDGEYVDPFAAPGEVSLWRAGDHPTPHVGAPERAFEPTDWDPDGVESAIEACRDPALAAAWRRIEALPRRAMTLLMQMAYYPTRFDPSPRPPRLYRERHPRTPLLDLPFVADELVGVCYPGYPSR